VKLRFKSNISITCLWVIILVFITACETEFASTPVVENVLSDSALLQRAATSGKHTFDDGSVYQGDLIRGKPDGFGRREFQNGDVYEGQFEKGSFHGHGTFRYKSDPNLDRYFGNWKQNMKHGYGVLTLVDGSTWEGAWVTDSLEIGKFSGKDGLMMSGKWSGDVLTEGCMIDPFGAEFIGLFNEDGTYLRGSLMSISGEQYVGQFEQNKYHGHGTLQSQDGLVYTGNFLAGLKAGQGILLEPDGSIYSGSFMDDLPDGIGVQKDPSGVSYSGSWEQGVKQGNGVIDFGDGTSYTGLFENGLAVEGQYDWGDGRIKNSFQDDFGNWVDSE
jgi:hypothetical protein